MKFLLLLAFFLNTKNKTEKFIGVSFITKKKTKIRESILVTSRSEEIEKDQEIDEAIDKNKKNFTKNKKKNTFWYSTKEDSDSDNDDNYDEKLSQLESLYKEKANSSKTAHGLEYPSYEYLSKKNNKESYKYLKELNIEPLQLHPDSDKLHFSSTALEYNICNDKIEVGVFSQIGTLSSIYASLSFNNSTFFIGIIVGYNLKTLLLHNQNSDYFNQFDFEHIFAFGLKAGFYIGKNWKLTIFVYASKSLSFDNGAEVKIGNEKFIECERFPVLEPTLSITISRRIKN